MLMRLRSMWAIKVVVAFAVGLVTSSATFAVSITINPDVANGPITKGSGIVVDGWVKGARTYEENPDQPQQMRLVSTNANKVKVYLFYQQTRPNPSAGILGSQRYQLDAAIATPNPLAASGGSSGDPDSPYSARVTANMPAQGTIGTITLRCWFLHCEALYDTPAAPNQVVAFVEKDVNLVYTDPQPGGGD